MNPTLSRRSLLQAGAATLAVTTLFGRPRRADAGPPYVSGYKALVCVQLTGGNNGFNWVVPTSTATYATYAASRTNLALAQSSLLALPGTASDGSTYGFHPSCPELQALFKSGSLAVACNVGPLVQPITAAAAQTAPPSSLPPQLFSHVDQQNEWATSYPQSIDLVGWGGRIADLLLAKGITTNLAYNINVGGQLGATYWQTGANTIPYTLGLGLPPTLAVLGNPYYQGGARQALANDILTMAASDPNVFVTQYAAIAQNAQSKVSLVTSALNAAGSFTTQFPNNNGDGGQTGDSGLDAQLLQVAKMIKANQTVGDVRQMFFVQLLGFDTHNGELATQARLLQYVSSYLSNFWNAMGEINMQDDVTVFTMSDFGRTLGSNGDGSDHAWGNHHVVLGGAVKGGQYYGSMPDLAIGGTDDFGQGRLVPSTSTEQYLAPIAAWFGVASEDLPTVFPNIGTFGSPLALFG